MRDPARTALFAFVWFSLAALSAGPATALAQETLAVQQPGPALSFDTATGASAAEPASADVTRMGDWVTSSGDNQGMPFIIIDKPSAEVFVFDATGSLVGAAPALLGEALGDDVTPGVGDLELADIPMNERTTEAGRFVAKLGPAKGMKSVLWVNFDSALSLHPVVTSNPREQRLQRLRSPSPDDRRITHGCINVPVAFYRNVVQQTFAGTKGVVYILPDTKPVDEVFPALQQKASFSLLPKRPARHARREDPSPDDVVAALGQ